MVGLLGGLMSCFISLAMAQQAAVDANGDVISLKNPPERILVKGKASLIPTDALFMFPEARPHIIALGRNDQGLGNFYSLLLPDLEHTYAVLEQSGMEEILRQRPDLVLTKVGNLDSFAKPVRQLGIPCFTMSLETTDEWLSEIPQLGKLLGHEARSDEIVQHLTHRLNAVHTVVEAIPPHERPRVLFLYTSSADGHTSFSVPPTQWLQTELVALAGGQPVWTDIGFLGNSWTKVTFEQIAAWNPDIIYLASYRTSAVPFLKQLKSNAAWQWLRAVKTGHIRALPADMLSYAQPISRWILCLQWLAADMYPEHFPGFDMETEIRGFYRTFYSVDDENILNTVVEAYRRSQEN